MMSTLAKAADHRKARRTSPRLEPLEGRELMACQIYEQAGVLTILGDNRANRVQVYDVDGYATEDESSFIEVLCDDGEIYRTSTEITRIDINLRGGNDRLIYDLGDPDVIQTFMPDHRVRAWLGAGNDQVYLFVNGFTFEADTSLQALGPGTWSFQFNLGTGHDRFSLRLNADLLGLQRDTGAIDSILSVGVLGNAGNDVIAFQTLREVSLELAQLNVLMRGNSGHDVLKAQSARPMTAEEASVAIQAYGDSGNDRIVGSFETVALGEAVVDHVIQTGSGSDRVSAWWRQRSRRRAV